jgi:hypothetical protein
MNIDLGYLGKVVLEELETPWLEEEGFEVTHDGYTESGIRVHAVYDHRLWMSYPYVWNNAIMIKVN